MPQMIIKFCLELDSKHSWFPTSSTFPTFFSKGILFHGDKALLCWNAIHMRASFCQARLHEL